MEKMSNRAKRKRRKKLYNWIFVIVLLVIVGVIVIRSIRSAHNDTKWTLQEYQGTESVYTGDLQLSILASATLHPFEIVEVRPEASGTIEILYVDIGDRVERGDPIALLDQEDLAIRVDTARAHLASAQASLNLSLRGYVPRELQSYESAVDSAQLSYDESVEDLEHTQELHEAGFASDEELDTAEYAVEQSRLHLEQSQEALDVLLDGSTQEEIAIARANVQIALASLTEAENALGDATIYAPMSGIVLTRNVTEGSIVVSNLASFAGGDVIMTLGDMSRMKAYASVNENDVGHVALGYECLLDVDAYPDEVFDGTVYKIHPQASSAGGVVSFTTEVEVPNLEEKLMAGMTCEVEIITEMYEDLLLVPDRAVADRDDKYYVFVVDEMDRIEAREIEIGVTNYEFTEVISGLEEGEQVIVRGVPRDLLDEVAGDADDGDNSVVEVRVE